MKIEFDLRYGGQLLEDSTSEVINSLMRHTNNKETLLEKLHESKRSFKSSAFRYLSNIVPLQQLSYKKMMQQLSKLENKKTINHMLIQLDSLESLQLNRLRYWLKFQSIKKKVPNHIDSLQFSLEHLLTLFSRLIKNLKEQEKILVESNKNSESTKTFTSFPLHRETDLRELIGHEEEFVLEITRSLRSYITLHVCLLEDMAKLESIVVEFLARTKHNNGKNILDNVEHESMVLQDHLRLLSTYRNYVFFSFTGLAVFVTPEIKQAVLWRSTLLELIDSFLLFLSSYESKMRCARIAKHNISNTIDSGKINFEKIKQQINAIKETSKPFSNV